MFPKNIRTEENFKLQKLDLEEFNFILSHDLKQNLDFT